MSAVPASDVCAEVSLLTSVLVIPTSSVNWYRHQRVASADPSPPWESLVRILVGLPALVFRYGRERPGQMSWFKPLAR
jgi:hypothetical protein